MDYDEVFAPVVKQSTLRILLSIASKYKLRVQQFDVKTAFLNGYIKEEIYMKQPPGFIIKDKENHVCLIRRSIYGLKQAPKSWNDAINETLLTFGFIRNNLDSCLYFKRYENDQWCLLLIYVDDFLVVATNNYIYDEVKCNISSIFDIKDLGEVKFYLGIEVSKSTDHIFSINQQHYIKKVVQDFGLSEAKISHIPLDSGYEKNQLSFNDILPSNEEYQKLIGCLLFISLNSRPDISASVALLSQKISKPTQYDWNELKRVVRYLKGTSHFKLDLLSRDENGLIGYADANWAENRADRKSNSGYIFKLNGGTIIWNSKKQNTVALSSAEAEIIALSEATKEALWIKQLLAEIDQPVKTPIIIYEDNQSCKKFVENGKASNRTKHIDVKYLFTKDYINKQIISCEYCPTDDMTADIFTKPLNRTKFEKFRKSLMLHE